MNLLSKTLYFEKVGLFTNIAFCGILSFMSNSEKSTPSLGEYLKRQRLLQGKSQRAIGGTALSSGYLSALESGNIHDVGVVRLGELADAYGVPVTSILGDVYGIETGTPPVDVDLLSMVKALEALLPERRETTLGWIHFQANLPAARQQQLG